MANDDVGVVESLSLDVRDDRIAFVARAMIVSAKHGLGAVQTNGNGGAQERAPKALFLQGRKGGAAKIREFDDVEAPLIALKRPQRAHQLGRLQVTVKREGMRRRLQHAVLRMRRHQFFHRKETASWKRQLKYAGVNLLFTIPQNRQLKFWID
jgi:hypothetical protein